MFNDHRLLLYPYEFFPSLEPSFPTPSSPLNPPLPLPSSPICRWIVYSHSLELMAELEEELLRVATYHMEQYTAQLYEAGRGPEVSELDRTAVLDDMWAFEAAFCAARHRALVVYFAAYRHAEAWGVTRDLFAGLGDAQDGGGAVPLVITASSSVAGCSRGSGGMTTPRPVENNGGSSVGAKSPLSSTLPTAAAAAVCSGSSASTNTPQPQLLAARVRLRRELLDLCFRCGAVGGEVSIDLRQVWGQICRPASDREVGVDSANQVFGRHHHSAPCTS